MPWRRESRVDDSLVGVVESVISSLFLFCQTCGVVFVFAPKIYTQATGEKTILRCGGLRILRFGCVICLAYTVFGALNLIFMHVEQKTWGCCAQENRSCA